MRKSLASTIGLLVLAILVGHAWGIQGAVAQEQEPKKLGPWLDERAWARWMAAYAAEGVQTPGEEFEYPYDYYYEYGGAEGAYSGGGGPLFMSALLPLDELERSLQGLVDIEGDLVWGGRSLFFLRGGEGFGGFDVRVGGFGAGGGWAYAVSSPEAREPGIEEVSIGLRVGGLLLETLLVETARGGLSFGALLGSGSWELELRGPARGDFASLVRNPPRQLKLERSFWFAMPYLSFEWKAFPFAGVRLKAGYGFALSFEEWRHNGDPVPGGPLRSVGFPALELMLIFGG